MPGSPAVVAQIPGSQLFGAVEYFRQSRRAEEQMVMVAAVVVELVERC